MWAAVKKYVSLEAKKGLIGYCFKYIDRPFCLQTDEYSLNYLACGSSCVLTRIGGANRDLNIEHGRKIIRDYVVLCGSFLTVNFM